MAKANDRSARDKQMSARLKDDGEERTTGKCAVCYATITIDSHGRKGTTKYRHLCGLHSD